MTGTLFPTHYEMRRPDRAGSRAATIPPNLPALARQLHRGRHVGDHAQHPGRARPRPARRAPRRQGHGLVRGAPQLTGTLTPMRFGADVVAKGVRERRFDSRPAADATVPGVLWTPPEDDRPRPVVMHRPRSIGSQARGLHRGPRRGGWSATTGCAAVAIDGPVHGDRRADGSTSADLPFVDFGQLWSARARA